MAKFETIAMTTFNFTVCIFHCKGLPGNPLIAGEFEKNEGELVTLSCTCLGGNPPPSVRWFKNSKLVDAGGSPTGNGDGQYTVGSSTVTYNNYTFTVSRSDNMVNYVCHVENSQTTAPLTRKWTIAIYGKKQYTAYINNSFLLLLI